MEGNIVGEPFEDFVSKQIDIRQQNQFSGYNSLRTNDQLQYLNNRNAWVKLASSVDILEGDVISPITQVNKYSKTTTVNFNTSFPTFYGIPTLESITPLLNEIQSTQITNLKSDKLRKIKIEKPEEYPGSKLAEKAILFNSLSSFNLKEKKYSDPRSGISDNNSLWNDSFAYGIGGTNFGLQPPPGITGVQVDSLNRGSIRKANVTLKAHNKFQFDIIELLYLRLGFTMMLEWGWDRYLDNEGVLQQMGNTIVEENWFTSKGISQIEMLGFIQEKREKHNGNYDGFFGKVSNFTWNFNPDGSYDISIDLITLGDVIESLKVNTSAKASFVVDAGINKINSKLGLENTNISKAFNLSSIGYFLYKKIEEFSKSGLTTPSKSISGFARYRDKGDNSTLYAYLSPPEQGINKQYYIRLDEFLSQLENLIIPLIQNGNQTTPQISISYTLQENLISYFPNQIPLDPKVCIFKPSYSYGDIKNISFPEYLNYLDEYVITESGKTYGLLMNLYINFEFIAGLLISNGNQNQELSLFKFFQDLCNGINDALGGVNKLEPVIKNDYVVTIIDQTLHHSSDNEGSLKVYGYDSEKKTSNFVKDIKFVSKITPQLASMVSIGATAAGSSTSEIEGTAFSKWNEGLVDRFTKEILEPKNLPTLANDIKENVDKYRNEFEKFTQKYSFGSRTFMRIFETTKWAKLKKQKEFEKDIRKVTDPYYSSIYNQFMDFDKFYSSALEIRRNKEKAGFYKKDDIKNLINKNYAVYLAYAFGGEAQDIKFEEFKFVESSKGKTRGGYEWKLVPVPLTISNPRYLEFNDTFISQGKAAYKNYINILNNTRFEIEGIPSSEIGFIPLSFDLILDGISGIKIYNKLNIDTEFLPSNYPESLNFIITKVNHRISDNNWETSLSTISVPKTQPYKFESTPSQNIESEELNITGPLPDNSTPLIITYKNNRQARLTIDNVLSELNPIARPAFKIFFETLQKDYKGYKVIINEIKRTWEESWNLKYNPLTPFYSPENAEPGKSRHSYGFAIDINIETPASTSNRTMLKGDKNPWIEEGINKVAKDARLTWGGDFKNNVDCVHFEVYYNLDMAYTKTLEQAKKLDSTISSPPFIGPKGKLSVQKIDKLIKEGKIKL
jgi:hypothetical protein